MAGCKELAICDDDINISRSKRRSFEGISAIKSRSDTKDRIINKTFHFIIVDGNEIF